MYKKAFYRCISRGFAFVASCMLLFACSKSNVRQEQGVQDIPQPVYAKIQQKPFATLESAISALEKDIVCRNSISPENSVFINKFEDAAMRHPQTHELINKTLISQAKKIVPTDKIASDSDSADFIISGAFKQEKGSMFIIEGYAVKSGSAENIKHISAVRIDSKNIKIPMPEKNLPNAIKKIYDKGISKGKGLCKKVFVRPFADDSKISPKTGLRIKQEFENSLGKFMAGSTNVSSASNADCIATGRYDRRNVRGIDSFCVFVRLADKGGETVNSAMSCFETKSLNPVNTKPAENQTIPCDFKDKYVYVKPFINIGEKSSNDSFINDVILGQINSALLKELPSSYLSVNEDSAKMIIEGKYKINKKNGKCSSVNLDIACHDKNKSSPQTYDFKNVKNVVECYMFE